jgi:hypothetical protein
MIAVVTYAAVIALSFSLIFICFVTNISSRSITKLDLIEELNRVADDDSGSRFYPYYRALFGKEVSLTGRYALPEDATITLKFFDEAFYSTWTSWYSYSTYSLGSFAGVDSSGRLVLTNGTYCTEGKTERHSAVQLIHGPILAITQAISPKPCYFELTVSSPHIAATANTTNSVSSASSQLRDHVRSMSDETSSSSSSTDKTIKIDERKKDKINKMSNTKSSLRSNSKQGK